MTHFYMNTTSNGVKVDEKVLWLNILEFVAVRDIQPGEEICVNYNLDPDDQTPVWWERDKIKKKKQHP